MEYNKAFFKDMACAVTGGASGIGLALCEELLSSGAKSVVLADFNKDNLAAHSARLDKEYPGRVKGVYCNVTIEDDVKHMVDEAAAFGGGRLDLLINCAGAAFASKFTLEPEGLVEGDSMRGRLATNEAWKNAFALNFYGALYGCRAALKYMLPQHSGHVVNIISGIAYSPMAYQSMYAATKAALNSLTHALRYEFWDYGVRFTSATPGTTATAIFASVPGGAPPEAQSPHQSAQRILHGVAEDERLVLGDDSDEAGGKDCMKPDVIGRGLDDAYLGFARQRRSGTLSFVSGESDDATISEVDEQEFAALSAIAEAGDEEAMLKAAQAYYATRKVLEPDERYYEGKTAIITGAASGVGFGLCEKLLEYGAQKVVLADINEENLSKKAAELEAKYPGKVLGVLCNVADEDSVKAMISKATEFFGGRLDILINNAGISGRGLFTETPDADEVIKKTGMIVAKQEHWDKIFSVNFYGPLYGCRAALPIMIAQGGGQIINIISRLAYEQMPFEEIYASSKAALNLLTLVLRYEYWETGVKFNSATPGIVATGIFNGLPLPECALTPEESATRILAGAARNERITYGDMFDLAIMMFAFNVDFNDYWDNKLKGIAGVRREGHAEYYGE